MAKKKKLFGKPEVVEEPIIEEKVEELVEEVKEDLPVVEEQKLEEPVIEENKEVVEEVKEDVKAEEAHEIKLQKHMEINVNVLDHAPEVNDIVEFAGFEAKVVRVKGERIFINLLKRI